MMLEELERRNYAQTTIRLYIQTVEDFAASGEGVYANSIGIGVR
jgi:hypothetical protein